MRCCSRFIEAVNTDDDTNKSDRFVPAGENYVGIAESPTSCKWITAVEWLISVISEASCVDTASGNGIRFHKR